MISMWPPVRPGMPLPYDTPSLRDHYMCLDKNSDLLPGHKFSKATMVIPVIGGDWQSFTPDVTEAKVRNSGGLK